MQRGDSKQDYEITTVRLTPEQKEWIDSKPVNFSALVRDLIAEAMERDRIDSVAVLQGIISERELLKSRCQKYDELLKQSEGIEVRSVKDINIPADETGGETDK